MGDIMQTIILLIIGSLIGTLIGRFIVRPIIAKRENKNVKSNNWKGKNSGNRGRRGNKRSGRK